MPASRRTSTGRAARFAECAPFAFGRQPPPGARRTRRRRARLVDPGPVAVAVDADAGKVDDARQGRRGGDRRRKAPKRRIAVFVGRRADEQRFGAAQGGLQRRPRRPIVDRPGGDAVATPGARRLRIARRAARFDAGKPRQDAPRRVAEPEGESFIAGEGDVDRARNSSPNAAVNPAERIARQYSVDFPCGGAAEARQWP